MNSLVPQQPPIVLAHLYEDQTYRTIDAYLDKGLLNVVWVKRPTSAVFAIPPVDDRDYDSRYTVNRLFVGSTELPDTNATSGTYDGRVFHYFSNEMDKYGVSRLEVAGSEAIPQTAVVVAFRSEPARDGKPGFVGGVTTDSTAQFITYFYPIVCISWFSNVLSSIFLATDPVEGPKKIISLNPYVGSYGEGLGSAHPLGGFGLRSCHFVRFSIN
ncbi:hypothetical protein B0H17DRAFT_202012 [Mycena rosella]|uniref:Uncharacterized protein n=1 Tax=Mycena rosella TaxID=1033263 RepID=A0AAD7G5T1_MYCRO|nr:hypothetical protein B0H17DRAFT_202012 [Mycena rosella]